MDAKQIDNNVSQQKSLVKYSILHYVLAKIMLRKSMIDFEFEGNPIPWARPGIIRTRKTNIVYDRQRREKDMVQWQLRAKYREEPLSVPIRANIIFRMPIPKSTPAAVRREMLNGSFHHSKKPDIDNLEKFLFDAMNGIVFKDDSQIYAVHKKKIYSEHPGTYIELIPESKNNHEEKEVVHDGYNLRDNGSGDILRSSLDKEGPPKDRRKENCVIPFRDGGDDN